MLNHLFTKFSGFKNEKIKNLKISLLLFLLCSIVSSFATIPEKGAKLKLSPLSKVSLFAQRTTKPHTGGAVSVPFGNAVQGLKRWSDNNSWENGKPGQYDDVIIPANSVIVIDENINVKSITVFGKLVIDPLKDINMQTKFIVIKGNEGYLECGSEASPYTKSFSLILKGTNVNEMIPGTGVDSKAIMVSDNARLELHGQLKTRWVRLDGNVLAGSNTLQLTSTVNWSPGDQILLTSTGYETKADGRGRDPQLSQTETFEIASVNGNTVTLTTTTQFNHFGILQTFNGASRSWTLDERAEVGSLSRNIKIAGQQVNSTNDLAAGNGGHIMIMPTATAHVSSIELDNMGQLGKLARYPFHWHVAGDVSGQYIKDSAIKNTNNRAVTVHGSWNAVVEHNIIYNIKGHAIFLENGDETGNKIHRNLISEVNPPKLGTHLLASDRFFQNNRIQGPAGIWLMNPDNIVTDNAVSSVPAGIWYSLDNKPHNEASGKNIVPNTVPFGTFEGNRTHGCYVGFNVDFVDIDGDTGGTTCKQSNYAPNGMNFNDFTGFSNYRSVWFRGGKQNYSEYKMANNYGLGAWVPTFLGVLKNSLVVGHTQNDPGNTNNWAFATSIYDGNLTIENSHFENFDQPRQAIFTTFGGAHKNLPVLANNGLSVVNSNIYESPRRTTEFSPYISLVRDKTGVLTGSPEAWIVPDHPFMKDNSFQQLPSIEYGFFKNTRFARLGVSFGGRSRSNNGKQLIYMDHDGNSPGHNMPAGSFAEFPLEVNTNRIYRLRFTEYISAVNKLQYMWGTSGDWIEFFIDRVPEKLLVSTNASHHQVNQVYSYNALSNASQSSYYYDINKKYMHFRLKYNPNKRDIVLSTNSGQQIALDNNHYELRPYQGTFNQINQRVEAEHFDFGGQEGAYSRSFAFTDTGLLNNTDFASLDHLDFRPGEVLQLKNRGNAMDVIQIQANNWINYSFDIPVAGNYPITLKLRGNANVAVELNGTELISQAVNTGTQNINVAFGNISLPAGQHLIAIKVKSGFLNQFDNFLIGALNQVPLVAFSQSTPDEIMEGYDALYLLAEASDPDNDPINVTLFINGSEIRQENSAPYEWGHANTPDPMETLNLPLGLHELKVVCEDNQGGISEDIHMINVVQNTLGLDQVVYNGLKVFPNPVKDVLNVSFDTVKNGNVTLSDMSGKVIINKDYSDKTLKLELANLSSGLYFLTVKSNTNIEVLKVIKE